MTQSSFTVLIVDDNSNNLFTLRSLIEQHTSALVLEAEGGRDALSIAEETERIDLIILDVQMPDLDGFQTASMLKLRPRTRDIPIIFLTAAYKTDEFQKKGFEVGGVDYLLKPIEDNLLINKISTYFRLIEKERNLNRELETRVAERTRELDEARSYLQSIVDSMGEALLVLDASGRIKMVNPAATGMLGYAADELLGMSIGDVFEEEEQEQASAFMGTWLEALIRAGALQAIEARFITRDGTRCPVLFSRRAISDEGGEISDIVCIAKDMSGYHKDAE